MAKKTSTIFLRCPAHLYDLLSVESEKLGYRSVQEYVLHILREREEPDLSAVESSQAKIELAA